MKSVNINAGQAGYAVIAFVPVNLEIATDSTLAGYAALYFKEGSNGSTVDVVKSDLSCVNNHNGEDNNFGTVVFEDSGIDVPKNTLLRPGEALSGKIRCCNQSASRARFPIRCCAA